jgi:hypothetical protein
MDHRQCDLRTLYLGRRLIAMALLLVDTYRNFDDEPQPGIVEVTFTDTVGKRHTVLDKIAVFHGELRFKERPVDLAISCTIESEDEATQSVLILFAWNLETPEELRRVTVARSKLMPDAENYKKLNDR